MIRLKDILENKILVPRRLEKREEDHRRAINKKIQQYIKNGSKGNLILSRTPITSLPDNLKYVGGHLNLHGTQITSLPDNLKVRDTLNLGNTLIKSLPNNLKVGGELMLYETPIKSLPDNLKYVGGTLDLHNSSIKSLPDNLKINGWLHLSGASLYSFPNNLKIEKDLFLQNTLFSKKYSREQIRKMIEDKGGYVKGDIII